MTRRWALQTHYMLRRITASIIKDWIWLLLKALRSQWSNNTLLYIVMALLHRNPHSNLKDFAPSLNFILKVQNFVRIIFSWNKTIQKVQRWKFLKYQNKGHPNKQWMQTIAWNIIHNGQSLIVCSKRGDFTFNVINADKDKNSIFVKPMKI